MPGKTKNDRSLTGKRIERLLEQHQAALKQFSVKRIGLFGSYATGQENQRSDVDFLVEFYEPTFDNFINLASYLEKLLQRKVELVTEGSLSPYLKAFVEREVRWHEVR